MIVELQDGDILTYKYNGLTIKVTYDSTMDDSVLDTDRSSVLEVSRENKVLFKRPQLNTLLDSHK